MKSVTKLFKRDKRKTPAFLKEKKLDQKLFNEMLRAIKD
jgi:hypothetical protein